MVEELQNLQIDARNQFRRHHICPRANARLYMCGQHGGSIPSLKLSPLSPLATQGNTQTCTKCWVNTFSFLPFFSLYIELGYLQESRSHVERANVKKMRSIDTIFSSLVAQSLHFYWFITNYVCHRLIKANRIIFWMDQINLVSTKESYIFRIESWNYFDIYAATFCI